MDGSSSDSSDECDIIIRKRIKISKRFCPHCNETLSFKTYKTHKRLYYDSVKSIWHNEGGDCVRIDPSSSPPPLSPPPLSPSERICEVSDVNIDESPPRPHHINIGHFNTDSSSTDSSSSGENEIWSEESDVECELRNDEEPPSLQPHANHASETQNALAMWMTIIVLFMYMKYHLSEQIISRIFRLLKVFFQVAGRFCSVCANIAVTFPGTLYQALKKHNLKIDHFKRYVVCKRCHQVYHLNECIEGTGIYQRSKLCPYRGLERQSCGTVLLKTVELTTGKKIFVPFLTYCYIDLKTSMQLLLSSSGFIESCEHWRQHSSPDNMLANVYDGKIWKDFFEYDSRPFLAEPYTYGLILNLDWFQPYKHLTYSVGVIYLSIFNLPSHLRYTEANTLLIGILPGPHEPKGTINTYLEPLVNDLMEFWSGVPLQVQALGEKVVRCALLCVSCDSPAGRKACGFLSHSANFGCIKCKKVFSGRVGQKNYSGFDRQQWIYRCNDIHRIDALKLLRCKTKTDLKQNETASGCRYSILLTLPYFDPTRMLGIDPMHTLFLCVAKHYLQNVWIKKNLISETQFSKIQSKVDRIKVPAGIGRIPIKIQSGFAAFTADQFKNWVLYYSILSLRGILIGADMECWKHFVLACRILCSKCINKEKLQLADALLLKFCKRTERQYGEEVISPSMHMICHLKECVLDYGPLHEFWLFPFERLNGSLGKLPNNNRSIEVQLMKRYLNDQYVTGIPQPVNFHDDFSEFLSDNSKQVGSLADVFHSAVTWPPVRSYDSTSTCEQWTLDAVRDIIFLPNHYTRGIFDEQELLNLTELYSMLFSVPCSEIDATASFYKYTNCHICSKVVGAVRSRSSASSHVMVCWDSKYFGPSPGNSTSDDQDQEVRPAQINYFAKYTITLKGELYTYLLVSLSWFKHHPLKNEYGKPVTVWECDLFEMPGIHSIIPIQFIQCRIVTLIDKISEHDPSVLFVVPCVNF